MTMTRGLRKLVLATHITLAVGWIGGVVAYLVLVIAAMSSPSAQTLRAAWISMDLIGWYLLVPLAFTSLCSGLVMALTTPWGLFRHYWVAISLVLTTVATVVLLQHMQTVTFFAGQAAGTDSADLTGLRRGLLGELLHAGLGLLVLLTIEVLNVYKPAGLTAYGRRTAPQVVLRSTPIDDAGLEPSRGSAIGRTPRWVRVVAIHALGVALLFVVMHLAGGGIRGH
jgi:hypothetical protein